MMSRCEQRLITEGYIATRTDLILLFKLALYSSTIDSKCPDKETEKQKGLFDWLFRLHVT